MKKKMWKRWTSLALTVLMLFSSVNIVFATEDNTWKDIQSYYPFSSWAVDIGTKYQLIFLEDNRRSSTRAEVANLLFNLTTLENNGEKTFTDISEVNDVLKKRIQKMSSAGIISGYEDGTFRPTNTVTRAEFAAMLCRTDILKKQKGTQNQIFEDISNHWAKEDINKIASLGIVSGKGDNKFCPEDSITPQELLVILDRLVNLNCIKKEKVISTILDTFRSKQYTEKEQYVIEIMYNKFDEVDGFMKYNFPYKDYYNYTNWQEFATAEDIQYIIYFMMSRKSQINTVEETAMFNGIGDVIKQKNGNEYYTISDMLYIINQSQIPLQTAKWGLFDDYGNVEFKYTNKSSISESDIEQMNFILRKKQNTILENVSMEFPNDAPITKYMLNYFAMKLETMYKGYRASWLYNMNQYVKSHSEQGLVTDASELPSNYADFPYIIKGIPKEAYEKHYANENRYVVRKPIERYQKYSGAMDKVALYIETFYDTILNIDYRNLDEEKVFYNISNSFYYVPDEDIYEYINYVKENEIVLKGTGFVIPGTLYISDGYIFVRTMLQFEVVSAKEMKNLLFGDMQFGVPEDITYTTSEYTLYADRGIQGGPTIWDGEVTYDKYKLWYEPILYGVHWDGWAPIKFSLPQ